MKTYKYSILVIAIVVGSEVIFKCLRHVYSLLHHKNSDTVENFQASCYAKRQRTVNKVIFFPDQGILSRLNSGNTRCGKKDSVLMETHLDDQHKDSCEKSCMSRHITRTTFSHENGIQLSTFLKRSTSLIHLINALDSARCSLKVCVYVITLQDMVDALVRAKNRGVFVRVMVEGQMPNEAALAMLRKNNIAVRISQSSQLLHHKFALVDAPDPYHEALVPGNTAPTGMHEESWLRRFSAYLSCKSFSSQSVLAAESTEPLLLTGSFNWTWTAVVNNYENVIISSDLNLIIHYNKEFDCLWENLQAS